MVSPRDLGLVAFDILNFFVMLPLLDFKQLGFQHFHRGLAVLVLAALVLAGDHYSGGYVGDTDRRFGLVDMLAACPARPEGVNLQILRADFHPNRVVDFGNHLNGRERGVPPA